MDFNAFPAQWEWVALIIGGVALIMAVPSIVQMAFGGPKVKIFFETDDKETNRYLVFQLINEPIYKGILKYLMVRRESAQDITAAFEILEKGSNRVVCPIMRVAIKTQANTLSFRVTLPASIVPAEVCVIGYEKESKKVRIFKEPEQTLDVGSYKTKVEVLIGAKLLKGECDFTVRDKHPFIHWDYVNS